MRQLLILAGLSVYGYAGLFSTVSGLTMKEIKPLSSYTLGTTGINPRVYEFTPQNDKSILCVVVFGNSDNGTSVPAMQCFKKK